MEKSKEQRELLARGEVTRLNNATGQSRGYSSDSTGQSIYSLLLKDLLPLFHTFSVFFFN